MHDDKIRLTSDGTVAGTVATDSSGNVHYRAARLFRKAADDDPTTAYADLVDAATGEPYLGGRAEAVVVVPAEADIPIE